MLNDARNRLTVEGARMIFKNFEGVEKDYNNAGRRNFCLVLDSQELIDEVVELGIPIKEWLPADAEEPVRFIKVNVNMDGNYPPKVNLISSKNITRLDASSIKLLDHCAFSNVDLTIVPHQYNFGNKTGINAYLSTMYATEIEDDLDLKYAETFGDQEESLPFN